MSIDLRTMVREVPDFPQPGVGFKDISPLLADPPSLTQAIAELGEWGRSKEPDSSSAPKRAASSSAAALAREIGCGFVPARRPGKLPPDTVSVTYALEYGENALELQPSSFWQGVRVLIHDDVLATGGTVDAIGGLIEELGGEVVGPRSSST